MIFPDYNPLFGMVLPLLGVSRGLRYWRCSLAVEMWYCTIIHVRLYKYEWINVQNKTLHEAGNKWGCYVMVLRSSQE